MKGYWIAPIALQNAAEYSILITSLSFWLEPGISPKQACGKHPLQSHAL
jgi:hypothetical protein